ncbi:MAG: hypothetical protein NKF70_13655 [Methanobacterium sp. ERen5]|nr:MAG: hypothetical protein NKF70_13655 [Methanobacterium sp. ERen5]
MILSNSTFKNNHSYHLRGAVRYDSSYLSADNCKFYNNNAKFNGGAIVGVVIDQPLNMEIIGCNFLNNTAQNGGSIFNIGNLTVKNYSIFESNSADTSFGAIYNQGNTTLQNVQFYNNNCTMLGGAVGVYTGILRASNCYFTGNSAGNLGGTISSANQNLPSEMYLIQCIFNNNTAGIFGGAVFSTGNITISDSNFDSDHATQRGEQYPVREVI